MIIVLFLFVAICREKHDMDCLNTRKRNGESETPQPTAPYFYMPQLPYNPYFVAEQANLDPRYGNAYSPWVNRTTELCEGYTFDNYAQYVEWGHRRRSLYEGVNTTPKWVSAPRIVQLQ